MVKTYTCTHTGKRFVFSRYEFQCFSRLIFIACIWDLLWSWHSSPLPIHEKVHPYSTFKRNRQRKPWDKVLTVPLRFVGEIMGKQAEYYVGWLVIYSVFPWINYKRTCLDNYAAHGIYLIFPHLLLYEWQKIGARHNQLHHCAVVFNPKMLRINSHLKY